VEVEDVLCQSLFSDTPTTAQDQTREIRKTRFKGPATAAGIQTLCNEIIKAQAALPVSVDARLSLSLVTRCMLANAIGEKDQTIEINQTLDQRRIRLAFRAPALAFAARFGGSCDPDLAFAALDSELANVLNLGWFETISTSTDGSTLVFTAKAA
jgi:hypothetical protein